MLTVQSFKRAFMFSTQIHKFSGSGTLALYYTFIFLATFCVSWSTYIMNVMLSVGSYCAGWEHLASAKILWICDILLLLGSANSRRGIQTSVTWTCMALKCRRSWNTRTRSTLVLSIIFVHRKSQPFLSWATISSHYFSLIGHTDEMKSIHGHTGLGRGCILTMPPLHHSVKSPAIIYLMIFILIYKLIYWLFTE